MKQMDIKEEVLYAKWVGDCFAFLTKKGVYHIEIATDNQRKVFNLP